VEGCCEHSNEPLVSMKLWQFLEQLSDWRLLKFLGVRYLRFKNVVTNTMTAFIDTIHRLPLPINRKYCSIPGIFLGSKVRPVRKADSLTAMC
jgi:hypothetical protein